MAHQAVGNHVARDTAEFGKGLDDQLLRYAHAKSAGQEFIENESLKRGQLHPCRQDAGLLFLFRHRGQRK